MFDCERDIQIKSLVFSLLLIVSVGCFALPPCPTDQNKRYHNCYGTYTWPDGNKYVGEFKEDKRNGQGTFTFLNGSKYVGEFKDGKMQGQGTYTWVDGNKYVGNMMDNKLYGQGTYTFANGDTYAGSFTDNPSTNEHEFNEWIRSNLTLQSNTSTKQVKKQKAVPKESTLDLKVTVSKPKENGEVTLSINTNADTASLKVNGKEEGGKSNGKYSVKKYARAGLETSFEINAMDTSGNTQSATVSVTRTITQVTPNAYETLNPQALKKRKRRDAVAIIIGIKII